MNIKRINFIHSQQENLIVHDRDERRLLSINHNRLRPSGRSSRILIAGIVILGFLYIYAYSQGVHKLIVFSSPTCKECLKAKDELIPAIEKKFKDKIQIEYRDITNIENYKFLISLIERHKAKIEIELPVFYFAGRFLNAGQGTRDNLIQLIISSSEGPYKTKETLSVDLVKHFASFKPLTIVGAGLADGINPCAFTVIVFFISFLALQGYQRRELIFIGLAFIFSVFLTYILLGIGIFNFLYRLKGIWIVIKLLNISVGILSIILGVLSIYDFLKFKKTAKSQDLILQLPNSIKNRIHSLIGIFYRKSKDAKELRPHLAGLILSAFITGFLVSLLEAVCTGQLYLPTIAFVLKTSHLKLQALGYLVLYNIMFVAPLLIIFSLALLGVTSEQFSKFLRQRLAVIKLIMAAIFFAFGFFLIWGA